MDEHFKDELRDWLILLAEKVRLHQTRDVAQIVEEHILAKENEQLS